MSKFGKIPTEEKAVKLAVIEAVSQQIIEETSKKLKKANAKLLGSLGGKRGNPDP